MPLPVAHSVVGLSLALVLTPKTSHPVRVQELLALAVVANLPDLDFLLVLLFKTPESHRGFTHSLFFGGTLGLLFLLVKSRLFLISWPAYAAALTSHCLLDFVSTEGGGGVELWWPFSAKRVELGWLNVSALHWQSGSAADLLSSILLISFTELIVFTPLLLIVYFFKR